MKKPNKPKIKDLNDLYFMLVELVKESGKKTGPTFSYGIGLATPKKGVVTMLELTITDTQKIKVTLNPTTEAGKPAQVDGAPKWNVQDGDAALVVAEDGLSADLVSGEALGDSKILVSADADLGSGVVEISGLITLHVVGAMAKNLAFTVGEAVEK
jgi:hypothetical protein